MKTYRYKVDKEKRIYYKIGSRWVSDEVINGLNELDGILRLDQHYNWLISEGEETKKSIGEIEQFRMLYNQNEIQYEKD